MTPAQFAADQVSNLCPGLSVQYPPVNPFYGMPVAIQITNGSLSFGPIVQDNDLKATICGYFALPSMVADTSATSTPQCPGCSINVAPTEVLLGNAVALPATVTIPTPPTASVSPVVAANNGIDVTLNMGMSANLNVPEVGMSCSVTANAQLTTQRSGSLAGAGITGPLESANATVVGGNFSLPMPPGTNTCPGGMVDAVGGVVGLPAPPGTAHLTAHLAIYASLLNQEQP